MVATSVPSRAILARRFFATFTVRARLLHLLAQILHLGDGEAGIVSHDDDVGGLEDPVQLGDAPLLPLVPLKLSPVCGWPAYRAGAAGCDLPPRFKFTRSEPGRTTLRKPAPDHAYGRNRVSEVRTNSARLTARKLGSLPRLCWPLAWIKRRLKPRRRQSRTGGRPLPGQPDAFTSATASVSPLRCPAGMPKRIVPITMNL